MAKEKPDSPTHEAMRQAAWNENTAADAQPPAGNLAVEYRNIDALIPYVNNARTHSDEQVAQIAASIREFGWTNPVLVDGDNGIIAGHGRVQAARKLEHTEIPVIELEGLSDAQKRAYVLADNQIATNADWSPQLLALEISALQSDGFDISRLGFEGWELQGATFLDGLGGGESPTFEVSPGSEDEDEGALTNIILALRSDEREVLEQAIRLVKMRSSTIETVVQSVIELARFYSAQIVSES